MSFLGDFQPVSSIRTNELLYGDNLTIMRRMPSNSVDLIYLDPPFNSQRSYNLIYTQMTGLPVPEQEEAFCDAWEMDPEKEEMARHMPRVLRDYGEDESLVAFWDAWINALRNTHPRLLAYLVYMAYRLLEMRRILKPTGSIYLHCDPTASHYIKIIMDGVFGHAQFQNELIWQRSTPKGLAFTRYPSNHDVILFYRRSTRYKWKQVYKAHRDEYIKKYYNQVEPKTGRRFQATSLLNPSHNRPNLTYEYHGHTKVWRWTKERMEEAERQGRIYLPSRGGIPREKRYLDEQEGTPVTSVWTDIPPVNSQAEERLGYPTHADSDSIRPCFPT